ENLSSKPLDERIRRLPKVIIVGVKKCWTRALFEYLKLHPLIKAPGPEPHFFDRNYHRGLDWYRSMMPATKEHEITMEKTPRCFQTYQKGFTLCLQILNFCSRSSYKSTDKSVCVLCVVFDLISLRQLVNMRRVLGRDGGINKHSSIVQTGIYVRYVTNWLKYFGRSNIHIVSGEELVTNSLAVLETVKDFIAVEREIDGNLIYSTKRVDFLVSGY
ncbi:LOW QUALITY PROTEIN: HS3S2-like protein, partial [Mya arenaria]